MLTYGALGIEFVCDGEALDGTPNLAMRFSWARCLCGITVRPRALGVDRVGRPDDPGDAAAIDRD